MKKKILKNIGATREGVLRKPIINDDETSRDYVLYSILKEE